MVTIQHEKVQSTVDPDTLLIRVDANTFLCDGGRLLPYPTYIGTVSRSTGRCHVWSPAASKPRGYRSAALRALKDISAEISGGAA